MQSKFAEVIFAYSRAKSEFEDTLVDSGFEEFSSLGGDEYDTSVEFYGVGNSARLSEANQRIVYEAGFLTAYLNHADGWETHYNWQAGDFALQRGWRRKREDNGFLVNYIPEAWGERGRKWVENGYMKVVEGD